MSLISQPVTDAYPGVIAAFYEPCQLSGTGTLVTVLPASSMNEDHDRKGLLATLDRQYQVEGLPRVVSPGVGDIRFNL